MAAMSTSEVAPMDPVTTQKYMQAFDHEDKNGTGLIGFYAFGKSVRSLKEEVYHDDLGALMAKHGVEADDGSGPMIKASDFVAAMVELDGILAERQAKTKLVTDFLVEKGIGPLQIHGMLMRNNDVEHWRALNERFGDMGGKCGYLRVCGCARCVWD